MRFPLKSSALIVVLALVLSLALAALVSAQGTDKVTVNDQAISNNTVTISKVTAAADGWIVIHAQANGNPGPDIGHAAVKAGDNNDVVVTIDPTKATPVVYAMLHVDAGTAGTYEFPGADVPVQGAAADVNPTFNLTGLQAQATPAATAAATVAPTVAATAAPTAAAGAAAAVTPGATAAPANLPTTGGDMGSGWIVLAIAGTLALAIGLGLNLRRAR